MIFNLFDPETPQRREYKCMSTEKQRQLSRDLLRSELGTSHESQVAWYHHMQQTQPLRYRPEYDLWEVFRYDDVRHVLLDHASFSIEKSQPENFPSILGKSDPPEHRRLRGLLSQVFTPRSVEELTPRLVQIVNELLEPAIIRGKMDVVAEFTSLLPVRVIAEMLGLPLSDQERFQQWAYQLFSQITGVSSPDNTELLAYVSGLLTERRRDPHADLISRLLAAEEDGGHLTLQEISAMCLELMVAGNVPVTMLLNCAFLHFCQQPEIYQALHDDPSLIPGTIEEILRYDFSPFTVWRTARYDTLFKGHQIKAGQYMVAWAAAANFDETYFPHSDQFDIKRSPNPHLTFSYGVHNCLGSPLARSEACVALERMVTHFSELRPDPDHPVQYMNEMGSARPIKSLGILFTPAVSV